MIPQALFELPSVIKSFGMITNKQHVWNVCAINNVRVLSGEGNFLSASEWFMIDVLA